MVLALKMNKLLLKEDKSTKIRQKIMNKINIDNVFMFYRLAKIYKLESVYQQSLIYIERCFPMIVDTDNFLELDFILTDIRPFGSS